MRHVTHPQMAATITRCRLIFSALLTAAVIIDPMQPAFNPWPILMGPYPMDPDFLNTVILHLVYSTLAYLAFTYRITTPHRLTLITTCTDVLFAGAIAFVTEGRSSLFYPFFTFAIVETGLLAGFRRTMVVTAASVGLWLVLIMMWAPAGVQLYIMRPVYLGIVGYLVGYLGEERLRLEGEVRALEATEQRLRIARDLHDGYAQVLAAVNLQLESCRNLLRSGRAEDALAELGDLQTSVNSEHDELRAYLRSLAGLDAAATSTGATDPRIRVLLDLDASGALVDQVLRIVREGVTNVRRHADASTAVIRAGCERGRVEISIDDDGRGFNDDTQRPWSILSRVTELGGSLELAGRENSGAHIMISLPGA